MGHDSYGGNKIQRLSPCVEKWLVGYDREILVFDKKEQILLSLHEAQAGPLLSKQPQFHTWLKGTGSTTRYRVYGYGCFDPYFNISS